MKWRQNYGQELASKDCRGDSYITTPSSGVNPTSALSQTLG